MIPDPGSQVKSIDVRLAPLLPALKASDAIIDEALEKRRLRLAIESSIATADAKAEGYGAVNEARLALMASQVADAFATKERIDASKIWNGSFLPSAAERDVFRK